MTEDVSANIRLSVTVCLLAVLVATVLNLLIIGQGVLFNFAVEYTMTYSSVNDSAINDLNQIPSVSGATLYRVLEDKGSIIISSSIINKDSSIVTIENLLNNAERNYKVKAIYNDGKGYTITAQEVL